jgi:hypothetical protein
MWRLLRPVRFVPTVDVRNFDRVVRATGMSNFE